MRLMHILDFFNVFGAVLKKFPSIEGLVFKAVLNNNTIGNHQNKPSEIVAETTSVLSAIFAEMSFWNSS